MKISVLKCPNCGQNIESGNELSKVKFCSNCGAKVNIDNYIRIENDTKVNSIEMQLRNIEETKLAKEKYKNDAKKWYILTSLLYAAFSVLLISTSFSGYVYDETVPKILAVISRITLAIFPVLLTIKRPMPPKDAEMQFKVSKTATFFLLLFISAVLIFASFVIANDEMRIAIVGE